MGHRLRQTNSLFITFLLAKYHKYQPMAILPAGNINNIDIPETWYHKYHDIQSPKSTIFDQILVRKIDKIDKN
jgi:hypothetical protein